MSKALTCAFQGSALLHITDHHCSNFTSAFGSINISICEWKVELLNMFDALNISNVLVVLGVRRGRECLLLGVGVGVDIEITRLAF